MNYFEYVGFENIDDARFLLAKAKKENYPEDFVNELKDKIQEYEEHVANECGLMMQ